MQQISGFWAGAIKYRSKIDLWKLSRVRGGWNNLEGCTASELMQCGLSRSVAADWLGGVEYQTSAKPVCMADPEYPARLRRVPGAPPVLFFEGESGVLRRKCVAVVGTRNCTRYGMNIASRLASGLCANGVVVISGLARGIDSYAHRSTLERGQTVAVLAHGLAHTAPASNRRLREQILNNGGLLVSEWPDDVPPQPFRFPVRNRWIASLSDAVVVIQAPLRSGSLITARFAAEIGRDVWVIPDQLGNPSSDGGLKLLSEGASLIWSLDEWLKLWGDVATLRGESWLNDVMEGHSLDSVARNSGQSISEILSALGQMEMTGRIVRLSGHRYVFSGD